MSALTIEAVNKPSFSLTPSFADGKLTVKFAGNADMAATSTLAVYLKSVHNEALQLGVKEVVVDLNELYFMNSSCFKSFVTWIESAASTGPSGAYHIKFLANAKLHWQRRSLEALRCLADHIVSVQT
ncbi:MAG TPA: hypothetical protein VGL13_15085 [Polyangiaceae bacterium]|jgi:hypothetical protein